MQFDERIIKKEHVNRAIEFFLKNSPAHTRPRSAFLINNGVRLPAKFIIRLAFREATGQMPSAESLTGGRASVRVLKQLGFEAIYEKPETTRVSRNPIKNARRSALVKILQEHFGKIELERKFSEICIPDLSARTSFDSHLGAILEKIESHRNMKIGKWQKNGKLSFDIYVPSINVVIEFDERQHFTLPRAVALKTYPESANLGFDKIRWIKLCEEINAGDNYPAYRDEQRAFYDSIRDIMAPKIGLKPVVRIFESDILWEREDLSSSNVNDFLRFIKNI